MTVEVIVQEIVHTVQVVEQTSEVVVNEVNHSVKVSGGNAVINTGGSTINDATVLQGATYSSEKIENRLDEVVGNEGVDLVLLLENALT